MSRSDPLGSENRREHPLIVLAGQPNCGKSTLFNHVAGYKAISSNFPGTTVEYTESHVQIRERVFDLVDLPGTYSVTALDEAGSETQQYLLENSLDSVINVIDASILGRSLELTLELMELGVPLVLCLNMDDEARRKGVVIDNDKLRDRLGIPVVTTIARSGEGVLELFETAFEVASADIRVTPTAYSRDVEVVIDRLAGGLTATVKGELPVSPHLEALKLIEGDSYFEDKLLSGNPGLTAKVETARDNLARSHGRPADQVISSERHSQALNLFEEAARVQEPKIYWRDKLDNFLLHSAWGYLFLALFLWGFFNLVFDLGGMVEAPLIGWFDRIIQWAGRITGEGTLVQIALEGFLQGLSGGVAIVLPFLIPFLVGLALIEDIGYLPRISYLMDTFMHRIGLHGVAAIPIALGYGCSVPAVLATRILSTKRERFIASVLTILIPCSARTVVILGLAGAYLGGNWALAVFVTNLIVIALLGHTLSRFMPAVSPGLVLEIPPFRYPSARAVAAKTWFRLREFIVIAWPMLLVGSIILSLIQFFGLENGIMRLLAPLTGLLDLPDEVGLTLVFGILRKELTLLMLGQSLGTMDISSVLAPAQIMVLTVFIVYYIPCLATLGVLWKGIGAKRTVIAGLLSVVLALALALATRLVLWPVF
ncbi:ferrous iron transport protein B [candidate division KSB1 bacterium]